MAEQHNEGGEGASDDLPDDATDREIELYERGYLRGKAVVAADLRRLADSLDRDAATRSGDDG